MSVVTYRGANVGPLRSSDGRSHLPDEVIAPYLTATEASNLSATSNVMRSLSVVKNANAQANPVTLDRLAEYVDTMTGSWFEKLNGHFVKHRHPSAETDEPEVGPALPDVPVGEQTTCEVFSSNDHIAIHKSTVMPRGTDRYGPAWTRDLILIENGPRFEVALSNLHQNYYYVKDNTYAPASGLCAMMLRRMPQLSDVVYSSLRRKDGTWGTTIDQTFIDRGFHSALAGTCLVTISPTEVNVENLVSREKFEYPMQHPAFREPIGYDQAWHVLSVNQEGAELQILFARSMPFSNAKPDACFIRIRGSTVTVEDVMVPRFEGNEDCGFFVLFVSFALVSGTLRMLKGGGSDKPGMRIYDFERDASTHAWHAVKTAHISRLGLSTWAITGFSHKEYKSPRRYIKCFFIEDGQKKTAILDIRSKIDDAWEDPAPALAQLDG